ncbi:MAG: RnfABCDGE type electron transport complex subunit D [Bacteroidales bacterium]
MGNMLNVSLSPHEHDKETTGRLMRGVLIALVPAFLVTVWFFGYAAILVTAVAVGSCVGFEYLIQKFILKTENRINDLSAAVTGVLLAFCLPVNIPVGLIVLGSLVAIGVGKMSFGGLGNNPFNPALVGRVFLFLSFPVQMTSWPEPRGFKTGYADALTGATPLSVLNESYGKISVPDIMKEIPSHVDLLIGKMGGSLGEIAAAALILGFIYLLLKKIITWHIPVSILLTITIFTGILWLANPEGNADPLYHLLSGGVMLGAIYMATDYVTSPMARKGMIIYGIGIGLLTVIIRRWAAYPEGVQFAILIMNALTPLINMYIKPKRFGEEVKNG